MAPNQGPAFFENSHHFSINSAHVAGGDIHIHNAPMDVTGVGEINMISNWVSLKNYRDYHDELSAHRTTGTGAWFLQGEEFQKWLNESGSACGVLWVTGKPGAGKSTLASFVVDEAETRLNESHSRTPVVFAYCRYLDNCTAKGILLAFIRQLLESHSAAYPAIKAAYTHHTTRQTKLTAQGARDLLYTLIPILGGVHAVIDGLDEVVDEEKTRLLDLLSTLPISILIFSRPLEIFVDLLPSATCVSIEAMAKDIEIFVADRIKATPRLRRLLQGKGSLQREITEKIKKQSDGMFLVAALQVEAIKGCLNMKSLINALDSLPSGVDDMYRRTMDRINSQGEEEAALAQRILLWIVRARGALTMAELQHALATSCEEGTFDVDALTPPEVILSVCCGLVVCGSNIDTSKSSVDDLREARLIHFTAQEFLLKIQISPFTDHAAITALTCTTYLSHHRFNERASELSELSLKYNSSDLDSFALFQELVDGFPFGTYAATHLGWHIRKLSPISDSEALSQVSDFLVQCKHLPLKIWTSDTYTVDLVDPYSFAVFNGLTSFLPTLRHLESPSHFCALSALHIAVLSEREDVVELLLSDPTVDVNATDYEGQSPLHLAVMEEDMRKAIDLLLSHSAIDVNLADDEDKTPLCLAIEAGNNLAVDLLLAHPNINVNAPASSPGRKAAKSALQVAILCGNEAVVEKLVARKELDINYRGWNQTSALQLLIWDSFSRECSNRTLSGQNVSSPPLTPDAVGEKF